MCYVQIHYLLGKVISLIVVFCPVKTAGTFSKNPEVSSHMWIEGKIIKVSKPVSHGSSDFD